LLREVEHKTGILRQLAACFTDHRNPDRVEHHVSELIAQRIYGLALGYEDVNDHDRLRHDPFFALLAGKADPSGADRRCANDRGKAIAGKSTLNRLELSPSDADPSARYKKIVMNEAAMDALLVDLFLQAHAKPPEQIVLDLDATDDPVHGNQEGRFFHGYYGQYCYLPLYIFAGEFLLCARLRPSNIDACAGSVEELTRIVSQIRTKWPHVPMRPRRDGEPDQGATALPVRRSDEHVADAFEPVAAVPVVVRLLPDAGPAAAGACRNRDGQGAMRNDTAEALEGGGADQDHGAKGLASPVSRASLRRTLRHGVSEPDGPSRAALLKNPGSVLPTIR